MSDRCLMLTKLWYEQLFCFLIGILPLWPGVVHLAVYKLTIPNLLIAASMRLWLFSLRTTEIIIRCLPFNCGCGVAHIPVVLCSWCKVCACTFLPFFLSYPFTCMFLTNPINPLHSIESDPSSHLSLPVRMSFCLSVSLSVQWDPLIRSLLTVNPPYKKEKNLVPSKVLFVMTYESSDIRISLIRNPPYKNVNFWSHRGR